MTGNLKTADIIRYRPLQNVTVYDTCTVTQLLIKICNYLVHHDKLHLNGN